MRIREAGDPRVAWVLLCALVAFVHHGCAVEEQPVNPQRSEPTRTSDAKVPASINVERLLGTYVVTEYARYRGGLTSEDWAKAQVGTKTVLSREAFALRGSAILGPRYATQYYEDLPEGEVPSGERRLLTNFYGFGMDRDGVTVLEVYESSTNGNRVHTFEVIDVDTLWDTYDGWLFQLCREGCEGKVTPLKDRSPGGGNR